MKPAALVTGASQGIGAAIARRLARDGFAVGLVARSEAKLQQLTDELQAEGLRAIAYPGDVTQPASLHRVLAQLRADLGTPRVLINNAGWGGPFRPAPEVPDDEWLRVLATSLGGARTLCQALLPAMAAQGQGRIVNVASVFGLLGGAGSSTYTAAKHALIGFTRALAVEWAARGITCNAVCPGYIDTAMTQPGDGSFYDEARQREQLRAIPAGRMGRPEEVAALVSFLASPDAGYCTGGVYVIDGGLTAQVP